MMGHVAKIKTCNRFHALTWIDEDAEEGEQKIQEPDTWTVVDKKKKDKLNKFNGVKQNKVTGRKWARLHTTAQILPDSGKMGSHLHHHVRPGTQ